MIPRTTLHRRAAVVVVLVTLAAGLTGCNSFDKKWDAAAATPAPANDITGRWQGTWLSSENGHTGELRAIITKQPDGLYHTEYHATYGETFTFTFGYALDFKPVMKDGRWTFAGEHDLGFPFGAYKYTGSATPTEFQASYDTKEDRGTYKMTRPSTQPVKP